MSRRRTAAIALLTTASLSGMVAGCGSSSDDGDDQAVELRIERERKEAAEAARRDARVEELRREVRRLKSDRREGGGGAPAAPAAASPAPAASAAPAAGAGARIFHAPSGNVSCQVDTVGARCTVSAIGVTFVVAGGAGRSENGAALPRAAGEAVGWGQSVTVGDVTCTVPRETDPRGVACIDASTGHGFEASRVPSRQRTF